MAPEQIKEITVTTVAVTQSDQDFIALAADPDRIFLRIHNTNEKLMYYRVSSTAPSANSEMVTMLATDRMAEFNTHVPTETVYVATGASGCTVTIEHASQ